MSLLLTILWNLLIRAEVHQSCDQIGKRKDNAWCRPCLFSRPIQIQMPRVVNWKCASKGQLAVALKEERGTRYGRNGATDFSELVDRRDTYFPLRAHKPPGERDHWDGHWAAVTRFFSSRARASSAMHLSSRRMNTRPFLPVAQRRPTLDNRAASSMLVHARAQMRRCGQVHI